eukprot:TRINITY_DN4733_c0_g1_i1.p1 TRINITY_DN4733_c0_g1~~TRINITY_DN4733_c0_g1_i1.p1  ORF type:complete len:330 (-),score=88.88 TRINITY_DN4733_c0_g1_i1:42-1031(-)
MERGLLKDEELSYNNDRNIWKRWFLFLSFLCFVSIVINLVITGLLFRKVNDELDLKGVTPSLDIICAQSCSSLCLAKSNCFNPCYQSCLNPPATKSVLGKFLKKDAIQHVGVTVSNLSRSVEFYTQILGGALVPGAGGDGWNGNDVLNLLFQKEMLDANQQNKTTPEMKIPDLGNNGSDTLAARYINFGSLQVELLDYRAKEKFNTSSHLPFYHSSSSPSVVNNMHIAWRLHPTEDLNAFINTLESECVKRGFLEVKCNRIISVKDEEERKKVGEEKKYNSFLVEGGPFKGWALAYCKGPDGEQFEFTQEFSAAKVDFEQGLAAYLTNN